MHDLSSGLRDNWWVKPRYESLDNEMKTDYDIRNARRCFKKSVSTLIATSRLVKGGIAARQRATSIEKAPSEDHVITGDDWEDGIHTDEGVKERLSLGLVLEDGVTLLSI